MTTIFFVQESYFELTLILLNERDSVLSEKSWFETKSKYVHTS